MNNIDRFMEATIPIGLNIKRDGFQSLITHYKNISNNGLKVELHDVHVLDLHHVFTFMPTLSSLYFLSKPK